LNIHSQSVTQSEYIFATG